MRTGCRTKDRVVVPSGHETDSSLRESVVVQLLQESSSQTKPLTHLSHDLAPAKVVYGSLHLRHSVRFLDGPYLPDGQSRQIPRPSEAVKRPAGHPVHFEEFDALDFPAGHAVHWVDAIVSAMRPAGHIAHACAPYSTPKPEGWVALTAA